MQPDATYWGRHDLLKYDTQFGTWPSTFCIPTRQKVTRAVFWEMMGTGSSDGKLACKMSRKSFIKGGKILCLVWISLMRVHGPGWGCEAEESFPAGTRLLSGKARCFSAMTNCWLGSWGSCTTCFTKVASFLPPHVPRLLQGYMSLGWVTSILCLAAVWMWRACSCQSWGLVREGAPGEPGTAASVSCREQACYVASREPHTHGQTERTWEEISLKISLTFKTWDISPTSS